ncbi:hypothetical protein MHUMG1_06665 [Metarhizium humberi]|uniref:Uncharacterized protein n=1 Tax=Metarhizium humberi TaxID=2596975 RepID=A0A9P8M828_9HYPO|nr:hypothetical protein MHUMG1_06665 [Metarhizium humberi]
MPPFNVSPGARVALGPEPEPAHVAPLPHHPPLAVQAAPGCVANVVAIQPTYTHQTRTVHQTAEPSTEQPTASAQVAHLSASTTQRRPKGDAVPARAGRGQTLNRPDVLAGTLELEGTMCSGGAATCSRRCSGLWALGLPMSWPRRAAR